MVDGREHAAVAAGPILHAGLHVAGPGVEVSRQVEPAGLTAEANVAASRLVHQPRRFIYRANHYDEHALLEPLGRKRAANADPETLAGSADVDGLICASSVVMLHAALHAPYEVPLLRAVMTSNL